MKNAVEGEHTAGVHSGERKSHQLVGISEEVGRF